MVELLTPAEIESSALVVNELSVYLAIEPIAVSEMLGFVFGPAEVDYQASGGERGEYEDVKIVFVVLQKVVNGWKLVEIVWIQVAIESIQVVTVSIQAANSQPKVGSVQAVTGQFVLVEIANSKQVSPATYSVNAVVTAILIVSGLESVTVSALVSVTVSSVTKVAPGSGSNAQSEIVYFDSNSVSVEAVQSALVEHAVVVQIKAVIVRFGVVLFAEPFAGPSEAVQPVSAAGQSVVSSARNAEHFAVALFVAVRSVQFGIVRFAVVWSAHSVVESFEQSANALAGPSKVAISSRLNRTDSAGVIAIEDLDLDWDHAVVADDRLHLALIYNLHFVAPLNRCLW